MVDNSLKTKLQNLRIAMKGPANGHPRPPKISTILKAQIKDFGKEAEVPRSARFYPSATASPASTASTTFQAGEMVEFPGGIRGMALNLENRQCRVRDLRVRSRHQGRRHRQAHTGAIVEVPVGNGIARPCRRCARQSHRRKGPIAAKERRRVDVKAPGIIPRKSVHEPMSTGLKAIDALIPIGRGQRELVIGDRQTGKTAIILDTILNQKPIHVAGPEKEKLYCVYVACGQKRSTVAQFVKTLEDNGALEYSIIVRQPPRIRHRCNISRPSPAAPWASTSATTACMR